jgi:hypothetical protein
MACDNSSTPPAPPSLVSISIAAQPTKTSYVLGDGFSSIGLALNAVYSDGSTGPITEGWTLSWNNAALAQGSAAITAGTGAKTVVVAYEGQTVSFAIYVNANPPTPGDTTPPAEVTGLNGTPGNGAVTLFWTDPADDDLNYIEITWTGGSVTVEKSAAANRANSKTVTGLINGTAYTFTVRAVDSSVNKSQGVTTSATPIANPPADTMPPANVTGLNATPGNGVVTLSWTDPEDADLDHIEITWTGGSATAGKSAKDDRANSKTLTGLTNGTAYTFTVKAVDRSRNKSLGETASATPTSTGVVITNAVDWTNALAQISADSDGTSSNPKVYTLGIQGDVPVPGVGSSGNSISGNTADAGGGVYIFGTSGGRGFTKTGGTIYGVGNGNATNLATATTNHGTNGHAAFYRANTYRMTSDARYIYAYHYRNETLSDDTSGNVTNALPAYSGVTLGIWTMR